MVDFSLLPDTALTNIVSFLPFKEAARTSVLSKTWSKIWHSTRNIEFDEYFFVDPRGNEETQEAQRRVFFNFITQFLENYNGDTVDKFTLIVSNPGDYAPIVERCLAFATEHRVKELRLDFSDQTWNEFDDSHHDPLFQLPKHVYGNASLEVLELYSCTFAMPDLCNLVALKDVSFGWIEVSLNTIMTLLSTLRKLEKLSMKKCWNLRHFDLRLREVGLRSLTIQNCHFVSSDYVDLNAPHLEFLKYSGKLGVFMLKVDPNVMSEAQLDFTLMPKFEEYGDELCDLLRDLKCVRVLTVCSFLLQALPAGEEPITIERGLPHVMNVKHLIVKTNLHNQEIFGFMLLLKSCVCLEKLTFELGQGIIFEDCAKPRYFNFARFYQEQHEIFECLRNTLKVVEVKDFVLNRNVLHVLHHLIKYGRVMEQVIVNVVREVGDGAALINQRFANASVLYNLPKGSQNLQIIIQ